MNGTSTKMPQMPTTTDGIAASRSTMVSMIEASQRGAYSAEKIATPSAGKNDRARPATEVMRVPTMKGQVP